MVTTSYTFHLLQHYKTLHFFPTHCVSVNIPNNCTINNHYFPKNINWLVFIFERVFVLREVETEFLYSV
jgi:hypothetical protein